MRDCIPHDNVLETGWKIVAFGASVTAQRGSYIDKLGDKFGTKFMRYAYGGDHLNTSGVNKIDKVCESCPTHCFIDWFSTGSMDITPKTIDCLETIVQKFSDIDCKLIFLFMPHKTHEKRICFYDFVKKFLIDNNLFFIDLTEHISWSDRLHRDAVHTHPRGSEKYASVIYDIFMKHEKDISVCNVTFSGKYSELKTFEIDATANEYVILRGECEITGFELAIGRHSGLVKIKGDRIVNTWDVWSHYDRIANKINNVIVDGKLKLEILQDEFDTTQCRRDNIDFTEYKKYLNIKKIFYIGDSLECEEIK